MRAAADQPGATLVGYHEYEGAIVSEDEKARLVRDLGQNRALILRNHGLVIVGRTIPKAFPYLHRLETACKTQADALAMNSSLVHVPEGGCEKSLREIDAFSLHANDIDALEFQAFMRMFRADGRGVSGVERETDRVVRNGTTREPTIAQRS